jgi:hypothetical protein
LTDAVAQQSGEVTDMLADSKRGRALMGGAEELRKAGELYLPRFPAEDIEAYRARLKMSWLFNAYRKTVKDMTGRVFGKPVELQDHPPQQLQDWCKNIDLQGNDLSTFARRVFEDALAGPGIAYIMVDAPRRDGLVTQAQAQAQNLRPFLVHLSVEDVLGWRAQSIDNVVRLTQIRILECLTEPDPSDEFSDVEIEQIRVLDRTPNGVQTRIFRKAKQGDVINKWTMVGEPFMASIPEIPVIPFYANRDEFFAGDPVLADLADMNIAHWQTLSDVTHSQHYALTPILFGAGLEAKDIVLGGASLTVSTDPNARLEWVEPKGDGAIAQARQGLKDMEFSMEAFGLQLLTPKQSNQSATGEALDAAKETSQLAMMADALRDAIEQAISWMCQFGGISGYDPSVYVNDDFGTQPFQARDLLAMVQAVTAGAMSREAFIEAMQRLGLVRSDITVEEEMARIEADQMGAPFQNAATMQAGVTPTTGAGMVL